MSTVPNTPTDAGLQTDEVVGPLRTVVLVVKAIHHDGVAVDRADAGRETWPW